MPFMARPLPWELPGVFVSRFLKKESLACLTRRRPTVFRHCSAQRSWAKSFPGTARATGIVEQAQLDSGGVDSAQGQQRPQWPAGWLDNERQRALERCRGQDQVTRPVAFSRASRVSKSYSNLSPSLCSAVNWKVLLAASSLTCRMIL